MSKAKTTVSTETPQGNKERLTRALPLKNDEFYTSYRDIEEEMRAYLEEDPDLFKGKTVLLPCDDPESSNFTKYFAQNFETLGLKKVISTSYAPSSKATDVVYQPTLFELESPNYDEAKTKENGKVFTLTRDINGDGKINLADLEWSYLQGDGDFRSDEVTALRDEADFIITNPPFSLFGNFMQWLIEGGKKFSVIGHMKAISYKDTFPLIENNEMWFGASIHSGDREFRVHENYVINAAGFRYGKDGAKYIRVKGVRWFTNIGHGFSYFWYPLKMRKNMWRAYILLSPRAAYLHRGM